MTALLELHGVTVLYGGVRAVDSVSLTVPGGVVGLIGPNGAGKTTLIDAITGFVPISEGTISFRSERMEALPAHERARRGLVRTFQSLELFEDLTIKENVLVGTERARWWTMFADMVRPGRASAGPGRANFALAAVGLHQVDDLLPTELSHGRRRLVGLARALAMAPQLVLLDEPAAGLDDEETALLARQLRALSDEGTAILLVDHDMNLVLDVCDQVCVLDFGQVISEGTPRQVRRDPRVVGAYLGDETQEEDESGQPSGDPVEQEATKPPPAGTVAAHNFAASGQVIVELAGVSAGYGSVPVIHDVDLQLSSGELVALLRPNGAGKTTILRTVSGIIGPARGAIRVLGKPVPAGHPHQVARRGVAHVPEDRGLFFGLTTAQSLNLAKRGGGGDVDAVLDYFPPLRALTRRRVGLLSGGEQQMLALAQALLSQPRVLMVDEMSLGLAPVIAQRILPVLRRIARERQMAVLLVEQHVHMVVDLVDRAYVLSRGKVVFECGAGELRERRAELESSYLGDPAT